MAKTPRICRECGSSFYRRKMRRSQAFCSNSCAQKEKMRRPELRANVEAILLKAVTSQPPRPATRTEIMCPLNWRTCLNCKTEWLAPHGGMQLYCRSECRLSRYQPVQAVMSKCEVCGSDTPGRNGPRRFCSRACKEKNYRSAATGRAQRKRSAKAREARLRGAGLYELVQPQEIFERDRWRCQLCGRRVSSSEAQLDHIIPVALGGAHVRANLQLACGPCNSRKGARLLGQGRMAI